MNQIFIASTLILLAISCKKQDPSSQGKSENIQNQQNSKKEPEYDEVFEKKVAISRVKDYNESIKQINDDLLKRELPELTSSFPTKNTSSDKIPTDDLSFSFNNAFYTFTDETVKSIKLCGTKKKLQYIALSIEDGVHSREHAAGYADSKSECEFYELKSDELLKGFYLYSEGGDLSGIKVTTDAGHTLRKGYIQDESKDSLAIDEGNEIVGFYGNYSNSAITRLGFVKKKTNPSKLDIEDKDIEKALYFRDMLKTLGELSGAALCPLTYCDRVKRTEGNCHGFYYVGAFLQLSSEFIKDSEIVSCISLNKPFSKLKEYTRAYDYSCLNKVSYPVIEPSLPYNQTQMDAAFEKIYNTPAEPGLRCTGK